MSQDKWKRSDLHNYVALICCPHHLNVHIFVRQNRRDGNEAFQGFVIQHLSPLLFVNSLNTDDNTHVL